MDGYTKSNREKALSPKCGKFWCGHCDGSLVTTGCKCPACGSRNGPKTIKKESSA